MHSHATGGIRGTRIGGEVVAHTFQVTPNDLNGNKFLAKISVEQGEPTMVRAAIFVETASDASTAAQISLGTNASSYNNMFSAFSLKSAAGTPTAMAYVVCNSDTDLYAAITKSGTETVGSAWIVVEVFPLNTRTPVAIGT